MLKNSYMMLQNKLLNNNFNVYVMDNKNCGSYVFVYVYNLT